MTANTGQASTHALVVTKSPFDQKRDGGAKRVAAVVETLQDLGIQVDSVSVKPFVATGDDARISMSGLWDVLRVFFCALGTMSLSVMKWYSPRAVLAIRSALRNSSNADSVLVIEYAQLSPYRVLFRGLTVLDAHNVESELMQNYAASAKRFAVRILAQAEARTLSRVERGLLRSFSIVTTVSARDTALLVEMASRRGRNVGEIITTTNGVDDTWFREQSNVVSGRVVFSAHLGWRPNIDAAKWLAEQVWPHVLAQRPEATLVLAGRSPSVEVQRLASDSISILGDVEDMAAVVAKADVATAPLLAAGGTRLKILEALAMGTRVVATPLGALGLEHLEGPSLLIESSPTGFAGRIVEMFDSPQDRKATQALVESYRWRSALGPLRRAVAQRLPGVQDGAARPSTRPEEH